MGAYKDAQRASEYLYDKIGFVPRTAIILGTGLGNVADCLEKPIFIDYEEIPNFPTSTVSGHSGKVAAGFVNGEPVAFMCGRWHYYEGYSMDKIALPIRALKILGTENLIVTNASGAINEGFSPADIVLIKDHIKLCAESPLTGENPTEFGERFFDMTEAYSKRLGKMAMSIAEKAGVSLKEGVYAYMAGPQFETSAEIRALRLLGADLVGMSTVPEVIAASHCSLEVLGLSCVTNMAAGMRDGGLNPSVIESAEETGGHRMERLIRELLSAI